MPSPASAPQLVREVSGEYPAGPHGAGWTNGVLAPAVSALEMMTAVGVLARVSGEHDGDVTPPAGVADAGGTAPV
jgi:hypothetical protein